MHQNRINESSNMLHYSNASSIEKSRRYLVIKRGACLVALARERGRQPHSRTGQQQRRSRSLPERRGGRNNEYRANKAPQIYQGNTRCSVCPNAVVGDTGEGGKTSGKVFPGFRVFGQRSRRGKVAGSIG